MTEKKYDGSCLFAGGTVGHEGVRAALLRPELPYPKEDRVFMGPALFAKWRELGWIDASGRLTLELKP